jgi:hypothetical protein
MCRPVSGTVSIGSEWVGRLGGTLGTTGASRAMMAALTHQTVQGRSVDDLGIGLYGKL